MTETTWIAISLLALGVGVGLGVWAAVRRSARERTERERRAAKEAQEQQARLAESQLAWQAKAAKDLEDARLQWQASADAANAAQRAELEKLTRHLTEAYDELDRLRVRVGTSGQPQPPDTGQGFAATMPLADL